MRVQPRAEGAGSEPQEDGGTVVRGPAEGRAAANGPVWGSEGCEATGGLSLRHTGHYVGIRPSWSVLRGTRP